MMQEPLLPSTTTDILFNLYNSDPATQKTILYDEWLHRIEEYVEFFVNFSWRQKGHKLIKAVFYAILWLDGIEIF